ncbi:hypothetical protein [Deinococcus kurensis]|uniref:hypothetical protein n=1 Tax=Deinococcus kurensis TaxID=2662757 RepID=UPI0012D2DE6A|nr:hypothetical protein [Deinococcus kurensis]
MTDGRCGGDPQRRSFIRRNVVQTGQQKPLHLGSEAEPFVQEGRRRWGEVLPRGHHAPGNQIGFQKGRVGPYGLTEQMPNRCVA